MRGDRALAGIRFTGPLGQFKPRNEIEGMRVEVMEQLAHQRPAGPDPRWEARWASRRRDVSVERVPLPFEMDVGAPSPHMFADGHLKLLTFYISDVDPSWDGGSVSVRAEGSPEEEPVCLVKCAGADVIMGGPNDEALHGHALWPKGLRYYGLFRVRNSPWLMELERTNSVHDQYDPAGWDSMHHFIFTFHDETVEILTSDLEMSVHRGDVGSVLISALRLEKDREAAEFRKFWDDYSKNPPPGVRIQLPKDDEKAA
jgi:hypothetical protein